LKLGIESRSGLQDLPWQMFELGLFVQVGSPYEKSRIGTPCKIENWESRVLRISHKSKMPYGCKPRE